MARPPSTANKKRSHRQATGRCGSTRNPQSSLPQDAKLDPTRTTRAGRRRLGEGSLWRWPPPPGSDPAAAFARLSKTDPWWPPHPTSRAVSTCGAARSGTAVVKTRDGQAQKPPGFGSNQTGGDPVRSPPGRAKPPGAHPPAGRSGLGESQSRQKVKCQVLRKSLALKRGKRGERGGKGKEAAPATATKPAAQLGATLSGALPVPDHPRSPCRACCPSGDPRPRRPRLSRT